MLRKSATPVCVYRRLTLSGMSQDCRTALHIASMNGDPEVVQLLLASGSDANMQDKVNET